MTERITREVAQALGDGPSRGARAAQRQRFVIAASRPRRHPRFGWLPAAGALVAASLLVVLQLPRDDEPLDFWVGDAPVAAAAGVSVRAVEPTPVVFADGSELELAPAAQLTVARASREEVAIELHAGTLAARIARGTTSAWRFEARPYRVEVRAAAFVMHFAAETSSVVVEVSHGVVSVVGPDGESRVGSGERLRADSHGVVVERVTATSPKVHAPVEAAPPHAPVQTHAEPAQPPRTLPAREQLRGAWRTHAARADYAAALAAARQEDLTALARRLPVDALAQLADVARYAGDAEAALMLSGRLRERFPGSPEAVRAAFLMGRVAMDLQADPHAAARHFRDYLEAAPEGGLALEARGRLIEALTESEELEAARAVAREYLRRHPDGPHADMARAALAGVESP